MKFKLFLAIGLFICGAACGEPQDMYESTVRISIQNNSNDENKFGGTGVIIDYDAATHRALVLSVGHLFDEGKPENLFCSVDLFSYNKGKLKLTDRRAAKIAYVNLKTDVSFLTVNMDKPRLRKLAPDFPHRTSPKIYRMIGCTLKEFPTLRVGKILCVNDEGSVGGLSPNEYDSYQTNIWPKLGNSGGALFDENENVIGVLSFRYEKARTSTFVGGDTIIKDLSKFGWKKE